MPGSRIGLWLIGAKGGVATTVMTGLANLARNAIAPVGLVTALEPFTRLDLVGFDDIVVGGHDIRPGRLADEARRMWTESRAILPELIDSADDFLAEVESRLRPGTVVAAVNFEVVPVVALPSWPFEFTPQQEAAPPTVTAQEYALPAATCTTPDPRPLTATGTLDWDPADGAPSSPSRFAPQQYAAPLRTAQVWETPALIWVTPLVKPLTATGRLEFVVELLPSSPSRL